LKRGGSTSLPSRLPVLFLPQLSSKTWFNQRNLPEFIAPQNPSNLPNEFKISTFALSPLQRRLIKKAKVALPENPTETFKQYNQNLKDL
jgi:hypothetical protein